MAIDLSEMADRFAICRLNSTSAVPYWATKGSFYSLTRTNDELSVLCRQDDVPGGVTCERAWRCLKVEGPLSLSLTGVLASIIVPLGEAGISILAIGAYETDYVLIKQDQYEEAIRVLKQSGHRINEGVVSL